MSESALVAAMRPNAYGSSTIGVKKSAVCTIASSSVSLTTPASSAVPAATSTRGSVGAARPATIGRRSAAGSLQPQPAPWEREVRAGAVMGPPMIPPPARAPRVHRRGDRGGHRGRQRPRAPRGRPAPRGRERAAAPAHPQPGARVLGLVRLRAPGRGVASGGRRGARRARAGGPHAGCRGDASEHARGRGRRVRARPRADGIDQGGMNVSVDLRFLGHAAVQLTGGGADVVIDPFLTGNPKAAVAADDLDPDVILLTHGHADHLGDTVAIAKRSGAQVVAIVELAGEIEGEGVENVSNPNLGGTVRFDWGSVKLVPAWHTAVTPSGTPHTPAGLLVEYGDKLIYHLGDTCLFSDLKLVGRPGRRIDVALMPIGGHFTMDRFDAVVAAEYVGADTVIPIHYGTFPPVETDAQAYRSDVQNAGFSEVVLLEPGETHTIR